MDMERIFTHGAFFVKYLQRRFWKQGTFFIWASYFGDPKYAYLVHFPIIYAISRKVGVQWLVAACVSECVNLVLKWILQEDRPYWWVGENAEKVGNMTLKQFPITCETGPGSPSGHVMVTTTLLYVLFFSLLHKRSIVLKMLGWSVFLCLVSTVAASRLFVAAHFPHQCLLGFTIGIALGSVITKAELSNMNSKNLIQAGLLGCGLTMGTYYAQVALDQDPNASLKLAMKWCVKRSYIHLDTTPLFASMRYTGTLLGTGVATRGISWDRYISGKTLIHTFGSIILGLAICGCASYCPLPASPVATYAFNCALHAVLFIALVKLVPEGMLGLFKSNTKNE